MNISSQKKVVLATGAIVMIAGAFSLGMQDTFGRVSQGLFNNPTVKWGAIITAVLSAFAGVVYLLASKDALKRKVTEYGEVGFVVINGKPKRYRYGRRKGRLVVQLEGQGKNIVPKLRDKVNISYLPDVIVVKGLESSYKGRRLGYELSIEYSLPKPKDRDDEESKEILCAVAFGFRDRNRYNEIEGTFELHLKNRCIETVSKIMPDCTCNTENLPAIDPDETDWKQLVTIDARVELASLRVSLLNPHFPGQVELKNNP